MRVNQRSWSRLVCFALFLATAALSAWPVRGALTADVIGVTLLRATTNLDGTGVIVADAETEVTLGSNDWEVMPSNSQINRPVSDITWYVSAVPVTNFPNLIGTDSWHSDAVGGFFYGLPGGIATNVAHIQNIEASYYFFTAVPTQVAFAARVVNQSFTVAKEDQVASDTAYDNYAARYNTLFVSGAGNGVYNNVPDPTVLAPSTAYNGLSVAAYGGMSSVGPTIDNARAKPDLTVPALVTSFSTPLVAGASAMLIQAALHGDGGPDTNSAADIRTLKALLLNGAVKPLDWMAPSPSPLDPRYGSGILNIFNSYHELVGGKQAYQGTTTVSNSAPHPPPPGSHASEPVLSGWDFNSISSTGASDKINHYFFTLTNTPGSGPYTVTATLVWNRQQNQVGINNLDLFLYNAATSNLVAASTSMVDNVEHIYVPQLPPGNYDLEVLKHGGGFVTASENYALAFEFFVMPLAATPVAGGVKFTWPAYPAGFILESNASLASPGSWAGNPTAFAPVFSNGQNSVFVNSPGGAPSYYRLIRSP